MRRLALLLPLLCLGCPPASSSTPAAATPSPRPSPAIATPSPALAEMVCALGARDHLVGVSKWCVYPPELKALPRIGGMVDPNLEAIDALAPDVILLGGTCRPVRELAERRGYRVERHVVDTIEDVYRTLTGLGKLLGREAAAKGEVARLKTALAGYAKQAPDPRPRTLLVFWHRAGRLGQVSSPGRGTFLSQCLAVAGGVSCLDDLAPGPYRTISLDYVVAKAPDLIIELSPEPLDAAARAALRRDWQVLSSVPAVAKHRIAIVSGPEILVPGPRLDQVVGKLARAVRGELDVQ